MNICDPKKNLLKDLMSVEGKITLNYFIYVLTNYINNRLIMLYGLRYKYIRIKDQHLYFKMDKISTNILGLRCDRTFSIIRETCYQN